MRRLSFFLVVSAICFFGAGSRAIGQAQTIKTAVQSPVSLNEYEGRFEFNPVRINNFIVDLNADGATLKMKLSHRQERTFNFESTDKFADSEFEKIKLNFIRDAEGKIKGITLENFRIDYYFDDKNNVFSQLKAGTGTINAKKIELPAPSVAGNTEFKIKGFPNAKIVALAGSFNNWNQSKNICAQEGEIWTCRVDLNPGRYTYKFIVDGAWMVDPANREFEDDEFGNRNSVIVVKTDK